MRLETDRKGLLQFAAALPVAVYLYFLIRTRLPIYALSGLMVLLAYFGLLAYWEKALRLRLGRRLALITLLALPLLGLAQYILLRDLGDIDHASYSTALWNFRHGRLHYSFWDKNMFGIHSQYTAFLWIPVQWAAGEIGLKLGMALSLMGAAWLAVYRYRQDQDKAGWALLAIVLSPPIASQFFFGFHPELIAAPALVLAFIAYREEKLGWFLLLTVFLVYSKETYSLAIGGLLQLALMEKRSWRWVLLPGLLCCALIAAYWLAVLPHFAPRGNQLAYFMPHSLRELSAMFLRARNLAYLVHFSLPFLPLMLALPKRYWVLPLPLMAFYMAFPDPMFVTTWTHYGHPVALLCAAGLVLCVRKGPNGESFPPDLDARLLLSCATVSVLCFPLNKDVFTLPAQNFTRNLEVNRLHARIPEDAALLINAPYSARFSARREVCFWAYRDQPLEHFDYILIDHRLPYWLNDEKDLSQGLASLSHDSNWSEEYSRNDLYLFRRRAFPSQAPSP